MTAQQLTTETNTWPSEMKALLQDVQDKTLIFSLVGLFLTGVLFGTLEGAGDPTRGIFCALAAFLLCLLVGLARRWSHPFASWLLVGGWCAVMLLMAAWAGVATTVWLLPLSAGIAALLISFPAGAVTTASLTILLLVAPAEWLPAEPAVRMIAVLAAWAILGLVWLALRPIHIAGEWAWSAYEHSQELLEASRSHQQQFQQTLDDLTAANHQLVRLNRLADSLRQAAEEAKQAKEQFVANVSHELRTPLNMIIGFSEMIMNVPEMYGSRLPTALLADLSVVLRNSQHLASLIDDVLDLSQIEAGQMALARERVSLPEIISSAITAVRPLFDSKGLYLRTDLPEDLPLVVVDRTRVRQVVLNLLSNAGRFTERGGVTVEVRQRGCDVVISVADTGPGIATTDQDRLFQPFQQADGSIHRRYGGSGLGLSISKKFVELHGGKMWLESVPQAGSTFYFSLPIQPPQPVDGSVLQWLIPGWEFMERTHRPLIPVPPAHSRWVVCESGESLHRLLARYAPNADVVSVPDVASAVREVSAVPSQALLVNAASTAEMLEWFDPASQLPGNTPVITCFVPGVPDAASNLGVEDYLVKPIAREKLLATLERLHLRGKTILIADDDPDAVRLFWRTLASTTDGYRVLTANDGRRAWEILCQERPDAILVDLGMPEMDGFELLAAKNADPALRDIPAVVISARDPLGHPIVSKGLAVLRGDGLSLLQLLACIEAVSAILSPARPPVSAMRPEAPPD